MFGFLSPRPHTLAYRSHYARLCQHQRQAYGVSSLPFHSYEAVFLYQLAVDSGAVPAADIPVRRCCKLGWNASPCSKAETAIGRYCASFALLLASVKLDDDVRDAHSWIAAGTRWLLRSRIQRAKNDFRGVDSQLLPRVYALIANHHAIERSTQSIPLAEYVEPTSQAFGAMFAGIAPVLGKPHLAPALEDIGRGVGAALLAYDSAVDWPHDRVRNHFNPLKDVSEVERALEYSAARLDEAAERCRWHFGHESQAAGTAVRVARRVRSHTGVVCPVPSPWKQLRILARSAARSFATGELALAGVYAVQREPGEASQPWDRPDATADEVAAEEKVKSQGKTGGGCCCDDPNCGSLCTGCAVGADCCECLACCAA